MENCGLLLTSGPKLAHEGGGGPHPLGGRAWGKAGVIWYDALRRGLKPDSDFEDCAKGTYISSGILYGAGSKEQKAVKKGWDKIGISI